MAKRGFTVGNKTETPPAQAAEANAAENNTEVVENAAEAPPSEAPTPVEGEVSASGEGSAEPPAAPSETPEIPPVAPGNEGSPEGVGEASAPAGDSESDASAASPAESPAVPNDAGSVEGAGGVGDVVSEAGTVETGSTEASGPDPVVEEGATPAVPPAEAPPSEAPAPVEGEVQAEEAPVIASGSIDFEFVVEAPEDLEGYRPSFLETKLSRRQRKALRAVAAGNGIKGGLEKIMLRKALSLLLDRVADEIYGPVESGEGEEVEETSQES